MADGSLRLTLTGDVMLGRGVDAIQAFPGDPEIYESWARSALSYVDLAEGRSGPMPRRVAPSYVWGSMLGSILDPASHAMIVNLESAVTDRGRPWPGKAIQYRMDPRNIEVLTAAGIDVVSLANNHVLDWSETGLLQTLETLRTAGITAVGAGENADQAWRPARLTLPSGGLVIAGVGTAGSGIPSDWAAERHKPGVALVTDFSNATIDRLGSSIDSVRRPGDVVVVSIHWGGNWGYGISTSRRRFAHRLIERSGVHVIHGHSSHHPTGIEVHRGRPILYGCGDLITDYEGIGGHDRYRGDLGGLYRVTVTATGELTGLTIIPTRMERFQLTKPSESDREWLATSLDRACRPFGTHVSVDEDGHLELAW